MLLFQRKFQGQAFPATPSCSLSRPLGIPPACHGVLSRRSSGTPERSRKTKFTRLWRAGPHGLPFIPRSALPFPVPQSRLCVPSTSLRASLGVLPMLERGPSRRDLRLGCVEGCAVSPFPISAFLCVLGVLCVEGCAVCRRLSPRFPPFSASSAISALKAAQFPCQSHGKIVINIKVCTWHG